MPRDISLLAAGEGSEHLANYLLDLAAGGEDSDVMEDDAVAASSEIASPSRPKSNLYSNLIPVLVGPAKKQFLVHPELLRSVSPYVANLMTGRAQEKQRKRVHYVRHKLQKMLFPKKNKAGAKELMAADVLLRKLEGLGNLDASNIRDTRIHKVLKEGLMSSDIPAIEQWKIKKRMHLLLTTYKGCLKGETTTKEPTDQNTSTEHSSLSLPHASETAFENFRHWLYQKQLTSPNRPHNGTWDRLRLEELVELYTLADFLRVSTLQNLIADALDNISPSTEGFRRAILHVSANPTTDSALLRLLVRMYANNVTSADLRRAVADWMGPEFHVELTALLLEDAAKGKGKGRAPKASACEYHVHDKNNPRCS